jgi:hypothetical protein
MPQLKSSPAATAMKPPLGGTPSSQLKVQSFRIAQ